MNTLAPSFLNQSSSFLQVVRKSGFCFVHLSFSAFLLVVNSTDARMACVSIWIKISPLIQSMNNAATDWPISRQLKMKITKNIFYFHNYAFEIP